MLRSARLGVHFQGDFVQNWGKVEGKVIEKQDDLKEILNKLLKKEYFYINLVKDDDAILGLAFGSDKNYYISLEENSLFSSSFHLNHGEYSIAIPA